MNRPLRGLEDVLLPPDINEKIPQIFHEFQYHASLLSQRLVEHSQLVRHPPALGSMGAGVSNCCNLAVFECLNPLNDIRVSPPLVDETL